MMRRESRFVDNSPERRLQEKEQTDKITKELIEAIHPTIVKHFDGKMTSLNVYLDSMMKMVSFLISEVLYCIPMDERPMAIARIAERFGPNIARSLLGLMLTDKLDDIFDK